MSLKCVSRQWLSLVTNPNFTRLHSLTPIRTFGLFFQKPHCLGENNEVYFVHLDDPKNPSPFRSLTFAHDPFDPERICIVQFCNGLLLCCTAHSALTGIQKRIHYVYNVSTNQVDTLPKHSCHNTSGLPHIGLINYPSKSLHYKVIAFLARPPSNVDDFYIYSSETGTWRFSVQSYFPASGMWIRDGVYWNGCMHWLIRCSDSRPVSDCLYFNVDEERLETFPRPPIDLRSRRHSYFGESEDHLQYIMVCRFATSFSVYQMKSDYSEWFVKYQVDLDPIFQDFLEMKRHNIYKESYYEVAALSLVRRENLPEDFFLVLEIPCKIICYNLLDRSSKVIWDFVGRLESSCSLLVMWRL